MQTQSPSRPDVACGTRHAFKGRAKERRYQRLYISRLYATDTTHELLLAHLNTTLVPLNLNPVVRWRPQRCKTCSSAPGLEHAALAVQWPCGSADADGCGEEEGAAAVAGKRWLALT